MNINFFISPVCILHVYSKSTESAHQESLHEILTITRHTRKMTGITLNLNNLQFTYTVITKTKEEKRK